MKEHLRSPKGYTTVFALILFLVIITITVTYSDSLQKKLVVLDDLKKVKEDIISEYEMLLMLDYLLKTYEAEEVIEYDEEGNEIIVIEKDPKIIIDDYYISAGLVDVINSGDSFIVTHDDISFEVQGDLNGIKSYTYR